MKKLVTLLLALVATTALWAQRFEVDGIYYYILTYNEVEVTRGGYSGSVTIPSTVSYSGKTYSVTSIGNNAFSYCSGLTSVTIGNSVTSIWEYAFYGCTSLTSVTIPNSVTSIGTYAFSGCTGLTNPVYNAHCFAYMPTSYEGAYTIPEGIKQIAGGAFEDCSGLTSITLPNSVTSIGTSAFEHCTGLTNPVYNAHCFAYMPTSYEGAYTIPEGIKQIAGGAFASCSSLTSVTIPNSVTSIGGGAFSYCSGLTSVTIGNSVTSIGEYAFWSCYRLTSVTIPNSVTSIENYAFYNCYGLTSIVVEEGNTVYDSREACNAIIETATNTLIVGCQNTIIPNSVTSIGGSAFERCSSLTSITIPNSVTSIGTSAFEDCSGLTSIESLAETPPTLGSYVFDHVSTTIPVYVPCGSVSAYQSAEGWNRFTNIQCGSNEPSTDLENTHSPSPMANRQKLLRNGQLIILRDGVEYNAQGQIIKE